MSKYMRMVPILSKYSSLPQPAKAALWFTICNFIVAGVGLITGPLFTRLIPPNEYGILTQFLTYEQIFIILGTWEVHCGAYQRGLFKYDNNWTQFSQSTILLVNVLTLCLFAIIVVLHKFVSAFTQMSYLTLFLVFLYLITYPAYNCWTTRMRTRYNFKPVVGLSLMFTTLNIVMPIIAILNFGGTASVKFNSTLITSILIFLGFYIATVFPRGVKFQWGVVKPQWFYMLSYEAPLVLHSLSFLVLGQADRVMIGKMVGNKEAAFYGVAYTLAMAVTILQNSLNQALVPWRYQKLKEGNYSIIGSTTNMILVFLGIAILAIVLIAPELMKILFPDDYYDAIWCIPPVSVSVFFMFLYSSFVSIETYYEKTKYVMYVSTTCGLLNVLLNFLCIPIWGYYACAYTTLLSYIMFAILHYISMKKVSREKISGVSIFSIRSIVLISASIVIASIISTILYEYWIIRYLIVVTIGIFAVIYRKKLEQVQKLISKKY